ncbi:MAG: hypothetical protein CEE43_14055 [Promethearchaeota archaeon Loki_b32]|nr:MAG: hypothetical protein CEE43_14055 [Candidatus Lokiarchaeota archaeon Loki_b32]
MILQMNESRIKNSKSQTANSNFGDLQSNFITNIKFWRNRLKFDTPIKYIYLIILVIFWSIYYVYIWGLENYFNSWVPLSDLIIVGTLFFAFHLTKKIPKSLEELIALNKRIIEPEEVFKKYVNYVHETFSSKIEIYFPIIFGIIYGLGSFFFVGMSALAGYGPEGIYLEGHKLVIHTINYFVALSWTVIYIIFIVSGLVILLNTLRCLNKLGTEEYPLNVTYEDLKIGAFDSIGKFIISTSIPCIILSTFFSIMGLYVLFVFNNIIIGYFYIITSILLTVIFSTLLYRNTIHIHEAIKQYKFNLKYSLIQQIKTISLKNSTEMDIHKKYKTIYNIHDYYEKVDEVSDWPFNPTSIKKLVITLSSSVIPLIISFFGLG